MHDIESFVRINTDTIRHSKEEVSELVSLIQQASKRMDEQDLMESFQKGGDCVGFWTRYAKIALTDPSAVDKIIESVSNRLYKDEYLDTSVECCEQLPQHFGKILDAQESTSRNYDLLEKVNSLAHLFSDHKDLVAETILKYERNAERIAWAVSNSSGYYGFIEDPSDILLKLGAKRTVSLVDRLASECCDSELELTHQAENLIRFIHKKPDQYDDILTTIASFEGPAMGYVSDAIKKRMFKDEGSTGRLIDLFNDERVQNILYSYQDKSVDAELCQGLEKTDRDDPNKAEELIALFARDDIKDTVACYKNTAGQELVSSLIRLNTRMSERFDEVFDVMTKYDGRSARTMCDYIIHNDDIDEALEIANREDVIEIVNKFDPSGSGGIGGSLAHNLQKVKQYSPEYLDQTIEFVGDFKTHYMTTMAARELAGFAETNPDFMAEAIDIYRSNTVGIEDTPADFTSDHFGPANKALKSFREKLEK